MVTVLIIVNIGLLVIMALSLLGEAARAREFKQRLTRLDRAGAEVEALASEMRNRANTIDRELQRAIALIRAEAEHALRALHTGPA